MARKTTKKAAKAKSNGAVKAHTFNPDHKITVLAKENPKREDSKEHKRFAKYRNGMLVSEAKEKGIADNLNLSRDVALGFIKIGG
jgi:hypothetical protein